METNLKNLDKNQSFNLTVLLNEYVYIRNIITHHIKNGRHKYTLITVFLEGLELLKAENPLINDEIVSDRRYYIGGRQKTKTETFSTNVLISKENVNWINNYISEKRKKDMFFSKADFMTNLVQLLKKKYGENLQD